MNRQISSRCLALLALLGSTAGMAATVTIAPSTLTPNVGDTFTLTLTGDIPNTFTGTMALAFDASKVSYVTGAVLAPYTVYTKNSSNAANPTVFDVERPQSSGPNPGAYSIAVLTFQALAAGNPNIVINDDGGNISGWFDDTVNVDYIPVTYTQANVTIITSEPNIAITDSVAPADDRLVPFGVVTEGTTSPTRTVTVTNTGNQPLVLGTVALANPLAAPYTIVSDNCSGQNITPLSSCTVGLEFSPVASGAFPDSFDIPSNDPDEPSVTITVSGTGTPDAVPNIAVTDSVAPASDNQIAFGSIVLNQTGTQTVTVANTGTANLTLGQVAMANALAAPFSIASDGCSGEVLAPAQSCLVQVEFQPTAVGTFSDSLDIPSDDPDTATVTVSVSGVGAPIPVPDIVVSDSVSPAGDRLVDFGDVRVPNTATGTVTVTNAGTAALVLGTVAGANPLAAPFTITSDNCSGQTLAPASSCTIGLAFSPDAIQPYNESFDIPSNDPDEPAVTVTVSGSGMPAASSGGSAIDAGTLLALGLVGLAVRRRSRADSR